MITVSLASLSNLGWVLRRNRRVKCFPWELIWLLVWDRIRWSNFLKYWWVWDTCRSIELFTNSSQIHRLICFSSGSTLSGQRHREYVASYNWQHVPIIPVRHLKYWNQGYPDSATTSWLGGCYWFHVEFQCRDLGSWAFVIEILWTFQVSPNEDWPRIVSHLSIRLWIWLALG